MGVLHNAAASPKQYSLALLNASWTPISFHSGSIALRNLRLRVPRNAASTAAAWIGMSGFYGKYWRATPRSTIAVVSADILSNIFVNVVSLEVKTIVLASP
jgi:hypothetical protein